MKKIFSTILFAACVFGWGTAFSQCTVNTTNTTAGFTPTTPATITQGVAYSQTVQVYVPPTYSAYTIDSISITSITGAPAGITYVPNPASGNIRGGANGAICFTGTTSAAAMSYPLTFNGSAYVSVGGSPATLPLSSLSTLDPSFSYSFTVVAGAAASCDTLHNISLTGGDTAVIYTWQAPSVGYVDGSGGLYNGTSNDPQVGLAEGFTATVGYYVNTAIIFPGFTTINATDSNLPVTIYVYDNSGTALLGPAGAPGVAIDSSIITLGQIAAAATQANASHQLVPFAVNFPNQPALATNSFFIGIALPQITGDTVVIFTNTGNTNNGNGWIAVPEGWLAYDSLVGGIKNEGLYIIAMACSTPKLPPLAQFTTSPTSVCVGDTITFNDHATPAAAGWGWSFGDGSATSSVQNPMHVFTAAGNYNVVEYAANGNGATEAVNTITVNANPSVTTSVTDPSSSSSHNGGITVTPSGASPYTYSWNADASTSDSIANLNPGTYSVTVTDANHCTVTKSVTLNATGIINLSNSITVSVYPNPASDVLNLVWSKSVNAEVSVIDLNGNVISALTTNGDMKTVYDIHSLATGAYILRITDKASNQQQSTLFTKF